MAAMAWASRSPPGFSVLRLLAYESCRYDRLHWHRLICGRESEKNMSASTIEAVLGTCPGLQDLGRELAAQIAAVSRVIDVAGNTILSRQGAVPDALHYLLDGQVALTQTAGGSNAVIDVVHPVSSLALASVVADEPHIMTAQAMRPSRLLEIEAAPLRGMINTRPSLAISMLRGLSDDVHAATRQVLDLKLRNSAQRLGCYLLSLAGDSAEAPVELRLPYQKRLLAARLGCRYENLSRAFAMLRAFGVETHGGRVILHDLEQLAAFAGPDVALVAHPIESAAEAFSRAFEL